MKKIFSIILLTFLLMINVNAEVSVSYDDAVKATQRYIYKFNKYDKYLITDKKYIELKGTDTAIIPFGFKNSKAEVNSDFTRGGLLNEEEFNLSKDSNGNTYLSQDVEFFLIGKKAVNTLNNEVIDAGDKKYGTRVTEFVLPGTKVKGLGTKTNPWEFIGSYKLTFYIDNGKITNNNLSVNKYIVYAVESTEGQIIINFEPNSGFEYLGNNCNFTYEYDKTNKIHKIYKDNKDINSDQDCTINLKTGNFVVEYDYNGGSGKCENLAVPKGDKISKLCTNVSREGYTFKEWQDEKGNIVTNDTTVNGNIKLIAQWEIKKTTLTIKPNGGEWNNQTEDKTIEQEYNTTTTIDNPSKGATYTITYNGNNQGATISKSSSEVERSFSSWKLTKEETDNTSKLENNTFTFGSGNTTLEANYSDKSNTTTLSTVSKTGHTCKWNTKSDGSGTSYNSGYDGYSTSSNITLYAICSANTYKVTLNNQSATSAGTSTVNVTYGKNISNITVPTKTYKVTFIHDSTKTEEKSVTYAFGGYYTSTNGGGTQYINANGSGSKAYDLANDTTLYAKWTSNSMTLPTATKTGYTLIGWYTASSGGTKVGNAGSSYTPTSNLTLYAQWAETTYNLTINPNGGKWNNTTSNSIKTGTYGSTLSISSPTPVGYTVSFDSNGGNSVSDITSQRTFSSWSLTGSGSMSGNTYTYGAGNGTLTANYDNGSITLPSVTKAGYKFKGWYDTGCSGTLIGNSGETYTPTKNITLKACYTYYAYILDVNPNGGTWNGLTSTTRINPLADPKPTINGQTDYTGKIGTTIDIANPTPPTGYIVSFNTNGGSTVSSITSTKSFTSWTNSGAGSISGTTFTYGEGNGSLKANYKNNSITLPTATKTGYSFNGWYTASSGGTKVGSAGSSYTPTAATTLYAQWGPITYTLTINPNGGKWNDTTSNSTKTGTYGSTLSISNPTSSGYTVSFDSDGGNSVSDITSQKTFSSWSLTGSGSMSGSTYTYGTGNGTLTANYDNGSITLPSVTKAGYKFKGWYDTGCSGTLIGNSGETYTPTKNITLKACYTYYAYILDVNPNGGTWNGSTSTTRINPLADSKPTINGQTDYTGKIGTTIDIANPTPPTGYIVSFNTNGGSTVSSITSTKSFTSWTNSGAGSISGTTFTYGEGNGSLKANYKNNSITLPIATKTGYSFNGWYTASSGGTKVGSAGSSYTPTAATTLYAQWTQNTYTLTIDPNGGTYNGSTGNTTVTGKPGETVSLSNLTVPSGAKATFNANGGSCSTSSLSTSKSLLGWYFRSEEFGSISGTTYTFGEGNDTIYPVYNTNLITLPNATRTGYTFNGWYTASSGGTYIGKNGDDYKPTSAITLYAQWSPITYNISYNLNNGTYGSSHPTSANYDSSVNISNPTKKVTINLDKNGTGATISASSVSATQTFNGWTATNLNTTTARSGTSSTSISTQWSNGSTKVKNTYFKNLTATNNATVTLTANWTQPTITLPTITKTGYTCGWSASNTATTASYTSGSTYKPTANGKTSISLYGVCVANAPKLKLTLTDTNGKTGSCSDSSCELSGRFVQPVTLTATTSSSPDATMTFYYNIAKSLIYDSTYTGSENMSVSGSGTSYKATRTITSPGKRLFKVVATNSAGKSATVVINASVYSLLTAYATKVDDGHVLHCREASNTGASYNVTYKCNKTALNVYSLDGTINTSRWYYVKNDSCWSYGYYLTTSKNNVSCVGSDPSKIYSAEG